MWSSTFYVISVLVVLGATDWHVERRPRFSGLDWILKAPKNSSKLPFWMPVHTKFQCEKTGFFPDKVNCKQFYRCLSFLTGYFLRHTYVCNGDLEYSIKLQGCVSPEKNDRPECVTGLKESSKGETSTPSVEKKTELDEQESSHSDRNTTPFEVSDEQDAGSNTIKHHHLMKRHVSDDDLSCDNEDEENSEELDDAFVSVSPDLCPTEPTTIMHVDVTMQVDTMKEQSTTFDVDMTTQRSTTVETDTTAESTTMQVGITAEGNTIVQGSTEQQVTGVHGSTEEQDTTVQVSMEQEDTTVQDSTEQEDATVRDSTEQEDTTVRDSTEQEDTTVQATTEQEDTTVQASTEQEDANVQVSMEQEDTTVQASTEQEDTTVQVSTEQEDATVRDSTEQEDTTGQASTEQEDATVQASTEQEHATVRDLTEQEDTTVRDSTEQEDTTVQASTEQEDAHVQVSMEQEDATVQASTEQEDTTVQVSTEHEDATVQVSTEQEDATVQVSTEQEDTTVQASTEQEDATVQASTEQEDATVQVSTEQEDTTVQVSTEQEDATVEVDTTKQQSTTEQVYETEHLVTEEMSTTEQITEKVYSSEESEEIEYYTEEVQITEKSATHIDIEEKFDTKPAEITEQSTTEYVDIETESTVQQMDARTDILKDYVENTTVTEMSLSSGTEMGSTFESSDETSVTEDSKIGQYSTSTVSVTDDERSGEYKEQICVDEGFFADPSNCSKFYRCVRFGFMFLKHEFTCAAGTVWDDRLKTCNFLAGVNLEKMSCKYDAIAVMRNRFPEIENKLSIDYLIKNRLPFLCPTGIRRHSKYCNLFYQCILNDRFQMNFTTFACPGNTVFNEEKAQCLESKGDEDCDNFEIDQEQNTIEIIHLPNRDLCPGEGQFPYGVICSSKYVECVRNVEGKLEGYLLDCPPGHVYSPMTIGCLPAASFPACVHQY